MKWFLPLLFALAMATHAAAQAQGPAQTSPTSKELEVTGNQPWTDTGVDLQPGQTVTITATGKLQYMDGTSPGPQGVARSWRDLIRAMPVNSAGRGALVRRWGSDEAAQPFIIGASIKLPVRAAGRLFLGINGPSGDSGNGSFHVKIEIPGNASGSSTSAAPVSNQSGSSTASTGGSSLANSPTSTTSSTTSASPSGSASAS